MTLTKSVRSCVCVCVGGGGLCSNPMLQNRYKLQEVFLEDGLTDLLCNYLGPAMSHVGFVLLHETLPFVVGKSLSFLVVKDNLNTGTDLCQTTSGVRFIHVVVNWPEHS